ncbi:MAG: hypothetical protein H0U79_00400 [Solirubrobacterales bacterium]|nr:hypothetical protein [Solirubrobacterales bacterium]
MKQSQIERLVATVPSAIDTPQRRRLEAYSSTARRCETQIQRLRGELEGALRASEDAFALGDSSTGPNAVLVVACELDTLERAQPRIDAWLQAYVAALVDERVPGTFGEGPA